VLQDTDKSYQGLRAKYIAKYLAQIAKSIDPALPGDEGYFPTEEKADGGRVGKADGRHDDRRCKHDDRNT
jgi:hypothetical protein